MNKVYAIRVAEGKEQEVLGLACCDFRESWLNGGRCIGIGTESEERGGLTPTKVGAIRKGGRAGGSPRKINAYYFSSLLSSFLNLRTTTLFSVYRTFHLGWLGMRVPMA